MTYKKPEPEKTKVKANPDDWWYSLKMKSKIKAKKFWSDFGDLHNEVVGKANKKTFGDLHNEVVGKANKKHKEKLEKKKSIKAKRILNSNASN